LLNFDRVRKRFAFVLSFKRYIKPLENIEVIAKRFGIRELKDLREKYGGDKWRKLKGNAYVELGDGKIRYAELHWYECHGIGKRKIKIKRLLD
jgi:hypothetical protein